MLASKVFGCPVHGATCKHAIFWVELDFEDGSRMFRICANHLLRVSHVPQLGRAIFAPTNQVMAVRRNINRIDLFGMMFELADVVSASDIPEFNMGIVAAASYSRILFRE